MADEKIRELAEWLHWKLCAAQNLPWEEQDCCDDCVELVRVELLPIMALNLVPPRDDAFYSAYANHCAIQGKVPMTVHSWRRAGSPRTPEEQGR